MKYITGYINKGDGICEYLKDNSTDICSQTASVQLLFICLERVSHKEAPKEPTVQQPEKD